MPVPSNRNSDTESDTGSEGQPDLTVFAEFHRDPSLDELETEDFPSLFNEIDGRLYPSSRCPYPLPVDGPEIRRLKDFHTIVRRLIRANYIGPVRHILTQHDDRRPEVLDLCTGTGTWLMGMAREFPQVLFTGIDIVHIATRYPLPNVNFEIGDITEEFRWEDATFDFVHARSISLAVHDYSTILPEVIRVMRPGGLFLSGEIAPAAFFPSNPSQPSDPSPIAAACTHFFQVLNDALETRGFQTDVRQIDTLLRNTGAFQGIEPIVIPIPIGDWDEDPRMKVIGRDFRVFLERFADSVKPLLRLVGHSQNNVDELVQSFKNELRQTEGLVGAYYVVQAIKA